MSVDQMITEQLSDPDQAVRLLALLEYSDDQIAQALVTQYELGHDAAVALVRRYHANHGS